MKSSSCYSFVHVLKKWSSNPRLKNQFFTISMWNRSLAIQSRALFVDLIFKKCQTKNCQFLTNFMWNRALATVSCTFCRPHLQKVATKENVSLLTISMWNRALATVSCTFCRPHLKKVVQTLQSLIFLTIFMWNRSLAIQPRAHFVENFPDRAASQPRKQTPSSGDHGRPPLPEKHAGFCVARVFSAVNSRVPDRSHPNYLMMMWLTLWCGWHDDWDDNVVAMIVRQLAMDNRP